MATLSDNPSSRLRPNFSGYPRIFAHNFKIDDEDHTEKQKYRI